MSTAEQHPPIEVVGRGQVGAHAKAYASAKVEAAARNLREPILAGHIMLTKHGDPAATSPAVAEVVLDVNGTIVRVQATADAMNEAIDRLADRLSRRLHDRPWQHHRRPRRASRASALAPMVIENAELTRHGIRRRKTASPQALSIDEAASEMELADVDFFLFREQSSGADALLRRLDGGALSLVVDSDTALMLASTGRIEVVGEDRPVLDVDEAADRLHALHARLLFFTDRNAATAAVVYRRHGGHFGLITFADDAHQLAD